MIPDVVKPPKSDIKVERTGKNKYKTISSTKRVNHVTTFKYLSNIFEKDAA